jgi:hypothetical protein
VEQTPGKWWSDWKYACVSAAVLLGIACFIVFVHHDWSGVDLGTWFVLMVGLFPGSIAASRFASMVGQQSRLAGFADFPITMAVSFLWYFALSYAAIKLYRLVRAMI